MRATFVLNDSETDMPVYLNALALQDYRGIGDTIQKMPTFKTFNFFIGANNAGKSAVLTFISRYLPLKSTKPSDIDPLERHGGVATRPIYAALGYTIDQALDCISRRYPAAVRDQRTKDSLTKIVGALGDEQGILWLGTTLPFQEKLKFTEKDPDHLSSLLPPQEWQGLWTALTRYIRGMLSDWVSGTIEAIIGSLDMSIPTVHLIPAIRQIGPKDTAFKDFSGAGLIDRLAILQNPEHNRQEDRAKFDKINGFLRLVTGRPTAEIEIPYSREYILVHMDGRSLPLSSLGTGIQEVIMIAAFCTLAENDIVCIEEPELHLHPLLQRKLVSYLAEATANQYFIATHSAAFIDTAGAAIFHVYLDNNTTHICEAILKKHRFAICLDLGHRASDIVQANAVVWVEGPSDRIYLKHWISIVDPHLVEGTHYSIMFYGGRLLSHLSADDEEVTEFIQLRDLNRHLAIIMDSDKASSHAQLNATKLRIKKEFGLHGGVAWITKGREIENYIDHARLQRAVKSVYSAHYGSAHLGSQFDHALHFLRNSPQRRREKRPEPDLIVKDVDKVKVSRAVVHDGVCELDVLDLRERVTEVVQMIRRANT